MLYHLANYLKQYWSFLNVVHYVSFRVLAGFLTTLGFSFLTGDWFIEQSKRLFRAPARLWTPEHHRAKDNLPTMGGIFILLMVGVNILLWCDLTSPMVWLMVLVLAGFGLIQPLGVLADLMAGLALVLLVELLAEQEALQGLQSHPYQDQ